MKNRFIKGIIAISLLVCSIAISGCNSKSDSTVKPNTENTNVKDEPTTEESSDSKINKESDNNIILIDNDNITAKLAENVENPELVKAIIDELDIDEQSAKQTRYYYNYVDLNNDGVNEIFVELVGPYTSGNGGDTAIIFTEINGRLEEVDDFTLIRNPIIISNERTNGWNDIIVEKSGGGAETEYVVLKYDGDDYSDVNESEAISNIDNISGVTVISNDMIKDTEEGRGLYLAK